MASIVFTDSIGAATLTNGKPTPGDRFASWTLKSQPIGDSVERDSDGARIMFPVRDDWGVTLELRGIPSVTVSGVAPVDIADRLCRWLLLGGQCAVHTDDATAHVYATCGLMPGTTPTLQLSNPKTAEYTLSVALINQAVSPVQMACHYRGGT